MLRLAALLGILLASYGIAAADPAKSYPAGETRRVLCQRESQVRPVTFADLFPFQASIERREKYACGGAQRTRTANSSFTLFLGIGF